MKHASFPATIDSAVPVTATPVIAPAVTSPKAPTRRSLFRRLLAALHHSRRLQARQVLAQYRHLIARPETANAKSQITGGRQDGG